MTITRRRTLQLGLAACILGLTACTDASQPGAASPAEPGTFAWFDLGTDNPAAAKDFYQDLFGWRFTARRGGEYWTIKSGGTPIGGMFPISADNTAETPSQWIPVIGVADAIGSSKTAFSMGARQVAPPAQTSDGLYCSIFDPTGAALDLYQGDAGLPISESGAVGTWIWADHLSSDPQRAARFYSAIFGYKSGRGSDGERVLTLGGKELAGLVYVPPSQAEANWLPYVAVADIEETLASTVALGGRILTRESGAAILLDPTGAAVGVIEVEG